MNCLIGHLFFVKCLNSPFSNRFPPLHPHWWSRSPYWWSRIVVHLHWWPRRQPDIRPWRFICIGEKYGKRIRRFVGFLFGIIGLIIGLINGRETVHLCRETVPFMPGDDHNQCRETTIINARRRSINVGTPK